MGSPECMDDILTSKARMELGGKAGNGRRRLAAASLQ